MALKAIFINVLSLKAKSQKAVLLLAALLILVCHPIKAETLHLSSLHWPPYSSSQLSEHGVCIEIAREALAAVGHELVVDFFPSSRAIRIASRKKSHYMGYLPAYEDVRSDFIFSNPISSSPLGLIEQKSHPVSWNKLSDLSLYSLGVVKGYANTKRLDSLISQGKLSIEAVDSDNHNVTKVASGRLDAAVIDVQVFRYILLQDEMKSLQNSIQLNRKLIGQRSLHVAFKNTEKGRLWQQRLNQGLIKIGAK